MIGIFIVCIVTLVIAIICFIKERNKERGYLLTYMFKVDNMSTNYGHTCIPISGELNLIVGRKKDEV